MKKYSILTFAFLTILSFQSYGQQKKLTPPQLKNTHPSKIDKPRATILIKHHTHKPLQGPTAKNSTPGDDTCQSQPLVFVKRKRLSGPKAKNTPLWDR